MIQVMNGSKQGFLQIVLARRELLATLVDRNLKIRYKGSALGFLWSLLTPGFFILIYAVFAKILRFSDGNQHYLQFLVSGIIIWQFTASCLNDSLFSIVGNSNLVKKVFFPRILLPLSTTLADAVNFLLTFVVLIIYLLLSGAWDAHAIWLVVPALLMQMLLCTGLCCLCGVSNVFFRDTQHIVSIISQAWFFMSPVFYDVQMQLSIIDKWGLPAWLIYLNPMTGILSAYRMAFMGKPIVPGGMLPIAVSGAVCIVVFFFGLLAMRSGDKRFGDVL